MPRPALRFLLDTLGGTAYAGHLFQRDALSAVRRLPRYTMRVIQADCDGVRLAAASGSRPRIDLAHEGVFGLKWPGGYRRVGPPALENASATREWTSAGPLPAAGSPARIDTFSFAPDPVDRGYDYEAFEVAGASGRFPAWFVPGTSSEWAIAVHGKGSNRREVLRALPAFARAGHPLISISYRNDPGAPVSTPAHYGYGSEWPDLEAAVACALEGGARNIILNGYSMGAAICLAFLRNSPLAARVSALVFDSPMLDFRATVEFGARRAGIPARFIPHLVESFRQKFGTPWESLNYFEDIVAFGRPVLIFHGACDTTIPVSTTDHAATLLGAGATVIRTENTEHVRSWNVDPTGYEAAIATFLASR